MDTIALRTSFPLSSILLLVLTLAVGPVQAASSFTTNATMETASGGFQSDPQGPAPPPSVLTSTVSDSTASDIGFTGPATATATANAAGASALDVDALFASGGSFLNSGVAMASFTDSLENTTGAVLPWTYDFTVFSPELLLADNAGLSNGSSLLVGFDFNLQASSPSDLIDITSSARLNGGIISHTLFTDGTDPLTSTFFSTSSNEFGYVFDDLAKSIGGLLAPGDTVTVTSSLSVFVNGPGFETGGKAFVGDPNDLASSPGFSGGFTVVPVPAALWLFCSGLLTFGVWLRRTGGG